MQNKIPYTASLGYKTNFGINQLEPIKKNMQMHTSDGSNHIHRCN